MVIASILLLSLHLPTAEKLRYPVLVVCKTTDASIAKKLLSTAVDKIEKQITDRKWRWIGNSIIIDPALTAESEPWFRWMESFKETSANRRVKLKDLTPETREQLFESVRQNTGGPLPRAVTDPEATVFLTVGVQGELNASDQKLRSSVMSRSVGIFSGDRAGVPATPAPPQIIKVDAGKLVSESSAQWHLQFREQVSAEKRRDLFKELQDFLSKAPVDEQNAAWNKLYLEQVHKEREFFGEWDPSKPLVGATSPEWLSFDLARLSNHSFKDFSDAVSFAKRANFVPDGWIMGLAFESIDPKRERFQCLFAQKHPPR